MKKMMFNGTKSFTIAKLTADILDKEGISDDVFFLTKYYLVPNVHKDNPFFIYMAYDSETKVKEGTIWDEIRHLYVNRPDLILTVDKTSYKVYKQVGFNVHYIPLGYDDLNFKEYNLQRLAPAAFIGSLDKERNSVFYLRYLLFKRYNNIFFSNKVMKVSDLNKIYNQSVIGINDIILGINQRCFEIPINGACMVVNEEIRSKLNKDYPLKEGKHYYVWESISDLDKILLGLKEKKNLEESLEMGKKAKEVIKKYPYSRGVKEMIEKWNLKSL